MKYVYGPVPSRRLNFSLGVDLVPYKNCTLDCIYCQIGRTTHKSVERKSFAPIENVIKEIKKSISEVHAINFITFSGSGEPTLNSDIGTIINEVKKMTSIPVAVLTNGTLLFREDVQKDLLKADVVLPSLDAASQKIFRSINRPHGSLKIEAVIGGLKQFRKIYNGQIWLEIMLLRGLNNNNGELHKLKKAVSAIKPDKIHLNTSSRPPSEIFAIPLDLFELTTIKNFLNNNCEVIADFHKKRPGRIKDVDNFIIEMTKRRPITSLDIANILGISEANAEKILAKLEAVRKIKETHYENKKYYSIMMEKQQNALETINESEKN
jgi:wyosine [tRNA(Phe)-imidazoG37] synthetase (radical SAM superfamily)